MNAYLARHHGLANLRIASEYEMGEVIQSIGVRPDRPQLRNILQKALDTYGDLEIRVKDVASASLRSRSARSGRRS